MKQRTDFWEKLEDDYANLGDVKRALSPDELEGADQVLKRKEANEKVKRLASLNA